MQLHNSGGGKCFARDGELSNEATCPGCCFFESGSHCSVLLEGEQRLR